MPETSLLPVSNGPPQATPARLPEIAKALIAARRACKPVPKTAYNTFLKAHYAPAEAIIEEAETALRAAGLAILPVKSVVNGHAKEGADRFELESTYLLVHEASGEYCPVHRIWPISQEKGTSLLKATMVTSTMSRSYFLLDLLGIARVDAEADANATPPLPPPPAMSPRPTAPPAPQADARLSIRELAKEHRRADDELARMTIAAGGSDDRLRQLVIQGQARSTQVDRIMEMVKALGFTAESLQARLREKYHVESLGHLTYPEAEEIESKFRAAIQQKEQAPK